MTSDYLTVDFSGAILCRQPSFIGATRFGGIELTGDNSNLNNSVA